MSQPWQRELLPLLPEPVRRALAEISPELAAGLEEIRLRVGRPLAVGSGGQERFLAAEGGVTGEKERAHIVSRADLETAVQLLFRSSLYAVQEQLRQGYVTVPGGHRVGFCGTAVVEGGHIVSLNRISSLSYRICREVTGAADPIMPFLVQRNQVKGALLLSPPLGGKTTVLRDAVRQLADGVPTLAFPGVKVCVVDERSEIAGCWEGEPQRYVGLRTDVLDAAPKAEGLMMAVRAMSPQVVATDELGGAVDAQAVEEALHAGVAVLATAHASSLQEVRARPGLAGLLAGRAFACVILLSRRLGAGTVEAIWGYDGESLLSEPLPPGPWSHTPTGPTISWRQEGTRWV